MEKEIENRVGEILIARKNQNTLQTNKSNNANVGGAWYVILGQHNMMPIHAGITLISLVITIIILLILAGVTINLTLGEGGIFKIAETAGEETQIAQLKEKADIEYAGLKMQDYTKEVKLSQVIEKLKKQGYKIETIDTKEESKITGITVNKETIMLNIEETGEIEVTINKEASDGAKYYAKLSNGYYEITLINGEIKIGERQQEIEKVEQGETQEEKIEIEVVEDVVQANIAGNKITVKGIKDGTSKIKIKVNGIEYKEIKAMVGWIAIYDENDLINMKNGLNKHYILMNDITLTKEWEAIGDNNNQFTGELEGNYHKINGLTINKPDNDNQGLFGYIGTGGKVSNLTLSGTVVGKGNVGMLAGCNQGTIENIKVSGTVDGWSSNLGGMVGNNGNLIEKCYANVIVNGNQVNTYKFGGLVGENNGQIKKSVASGKVTGNQRVGGLVGENGSNKIIEDSYSIGEVSAKSYDVGGLVGSNYGTIRNTYSISKVDGKSRVGGILGYTYNGTVKNSYWTPEKSSIKESVTEINTTGTKIETDELMQTQATYVGFDFTSENPVWIMKTYPELNYNFGGK